MGRLGDELRKFRDQLKKFIEENLPPPEELIRKESNLSPVTRDQIIESVNKSIESVCALFEDLIPYLRDIRIRFRPTYRLVASVSKSGCLSVGLGWTFLDAVDPSVDQRAKEYLVLHELGHLLGAFHKRVGSRNKPLFNISQDIVINERLDEHPRYSDLKDIHPLIMVGMRRSIIQAIVGVSVPDDLHLRSAEGVYNWLNQLDLENKLMLKLSTDSMEREDWQQLQDLLEDKYKDLIDEIRELLDRLPKIGGSAQDGIQRPWETMEEILPGETPWDDEKEMERRAKESNRIREAKRRNSMNKERGIGNDFLGLELFEWVLKPKVPAWAKRLRIKFRNIASDVGDDDEKIYPLHRRRHLIPRNRLPKADRIGYKTKIAVLVDTSGSIADEELDEAGSTILGLARAYGMEVVTAFCSVAVTDVKKIRRPSDFKDAKIDRGGTNMANGIKFLDQMSDIGAILVITDCATPWPDRKPTHPVIVISFEEDVEVPPWADKIYYWER